MQADVVALAQQFALNQGNQVLLESFYDEAIKLLGDEEVIVQGTVIPVTSGQPSYPWPEDTVRSVAAFFGPRELTQTTLVALDEDDRTWASQTGSPIMYLEMHELNHTVRLYPTPAATSAGVPLAPNPFGADYANDRFVLFTVSHVDALPAWIELPFALLLVSREFARPSPIRDTAWAEQAMTLAQLLRRYAGTP